MMDHWNSIYSNTSLNSLGWYQEEPQPDLDIITSLELPKQSKIVIAGAGSTTLLDHLLFQGYYNIVVIDISSIALKSLNDRISPIPGSDHVTFLTDDLTQLKISPEITDCDLWIDRAVLHFFTTPQEQASYQLLIHEIQPKYLLLAQFSTSGAKKCSGLDVIQYDRPKLDHFAGDIYESIQILDFLYINPSGGQRPYIYGLYQLQNTKFPTK